MLLVRFITILFILNNPAFASEKKPGFAIPWKSNQQSLYKEKNTFAWKKSGGLALNEFFGLEGSVYNIDYHDKLRYNPDERVGYIKENEYTLNFLGVGKIPLTQNFALFGKAGPSYFQDPLQVNSSPQKELYLSSEENLKQLGITYSTGARLNLTPSVELSLEYLHTQNDVANLDGSVAQMSWKF